MIKRMVLSLLFLLLLLHGVRLPKAEAVCAVVKIEILQELTLERVAFDAKLVITNNMPDTTLDNVRVDVFIQDGAGNDKGSLFYVRPPVLTNLSAVDGTGTVAQAATAEAHWLIIPAPGAGVILENGALKQLGVDYFVGATLSYSVDGVKEVVPITPDRITVKPMPELVLDYFSPFEVLGDNPFTPQVEAPVPFPLAVRVMNTGYGPAASLKIDSAQPKIVENLQGLLVNFRLLGASVNDSAVSPSLTVPIGTLDSMKAATAYWEMIATLSGKFIEFNVTFSHASELGGELTSLLKATNAHYLVHRVLVNLPGRDTRLDFLSDSTNDPDDLPDAIYESEIPNGVGTIEYARSPVTSVNVTTPPSGRPTTEAPEVVVGVQVGQTGWVYARFDDPGQGLLKLLDVVRADGVHLDPHNFWIQESLNESYQRIYRVHFLDYRVDAATTGTYRLVYTKPDADTVPPTTTLLFDGPSAGTEPVSLTPATRIVFTARDNEGGSGVDQMFRKIVGTDADFLPAYPMNLDKAGTYTLEYYSVDRAGNEETVKSITIIVDTGVPAISSFRASPSLITPHAPRGIAAPRSAAFLVTATDDQASLSAKVEISRGTEFSAGTVVRTLSGTIASGTESSLIWDGKDQTGAFVASGAYTARISVTDGLDSSGSSHTATAATAVTVADWFTGQPLDPNPAAAQQHPRVSGTRVVWQDQRSGNWDIYTKDTSAAASQAVTNNSADQTYPAISGNVIVWQDDRSGNWDIYGYDLSLGKEFVVSAEAGNQERPVISGEWVAWQDDRNGNKDIYAYNLTTHEQVRVTDHVRDQIHPSFSGTTLTWEDYRYGLGEVFTYDLLSRTETRYTVNIENQTLPAGDGTLLVWTDQRNAQRDVYYSPSMNTEVRVTYGTGDHSQAVIRDGVIVYTDYEAGIGDPNLAFYDATSGVGALLTAHAARQEEPALGAGMLAWQDDRDGAAQIYWSPFSVEPTPISAEVRRGLNLVAVGELLATSYATTSALIAAKPNGITIDRVVVYSSQNGAFLDTAKGDDISLQKGMAIGLYASGSGILDLAASGETVSSYTFLPGLNYAGMLAVPNGYSAYRMIASLGLDNVQSLRRFNSETGAWETATIRDISGVKAPAGADFALRQGDGVIVEMKQRVDGWRP